MRVKTFAFILSALFLAGCADVAAHRTGASLYEAKPTDCKIQLYNFPPDRPFEEVGMLEMSGGNALDRYLVKMKEAACQLGGDAILFIQMNDAVVGYKSGNKNYEATPFREKDGRAVVIRFN